MLRSIFFITSAFALVAASVPNKSEAAATGLSATQSTPARAPCRPLLSGLLRSALGSGLIRSPLDR